MRGELRKGARRDRLTALVHEQAPELPNHDTMTPQECVAAVDTLKETRTVLDEQIVEHGAYERWSRIAIATHVFQPELAPTFSSDYYLREKLSDAVLTGKCPGHFALALRLCEDEQPLPSLAKLREEGADPIQDVLRAVRQEHNGANGPMPAENMESILWLLCCSPKGFKPKTKDVILKYLAKDEGLSARAVTSIEKTTFLRAVMRLLERGEPASYTTAERDQLDHWFDQHTIEGDLGERLALKTALRLATTPELSFDSKGRPHTVPASDRAVGRPAPLPPRNQL